MSRAHWLALVLVGAAFGSSFGLNEILLSSYGPLTVSAGRVGLGALGCWAWVVATGRRPDFPAAGLVWIGAFGLFQYGAPFALLPLAQQHVTSSVAGIANAMTPVAVVVVSLLWPGGERITLPRFVGIALGVLGITILVTQGAQAGGSEPLFILVAALAPVCYGVALNLVRRFHGMDPIVMTALAMTGAACAIVPAAFAVEGAPRVPTGAEAAAFAVIGFGLTSTTFLIMYSILPKVGATNLSLVTLVAPVSATLIGAGVFGEVIGGGHLSGMALILAGLVAIDGRVWRVLSRSLRALRRSARAVSPRPHGDAGFRPRSVIGPG